MGTGASTSKFVNCILGNKSNNRHAVAAIKEHQNSSIPLFTATKHLAVVGFLYFPVTLLLFRIVFCGIIPIQMDTRSGLIPEKPMQSIHYWIRLNHPELVWVRII